MSAAQRDTPSLCKNAVIETYALWWNGYRHQVLGRATYHLITSTLFPPVRTTTTVFFLRRKEETAC
jgi:hypothetical protein